MAEKTGHPAISQREYLKRYLGKSQGNKLKKKHRKVSSGQKRTQIIDDDISVKQVQSEHVLELYSDDDGPQIAAIIDERPEEIRMLEKYRNTDRWTRVDQDGKKGVSYPEMQEKLPSRDVSRLHSLNDRDVSHSRNQRTYNKRDETIDTERAATIHPKDPEWSSNINHGGTAMERKSIKTKCAQSEASKNVTKMSAEETAIHRGDGRLKGLVQKQSKPPTEDQTGRDKSKGTHTSRDAHGDTNEHHTSKVHARHISKDTEIFKKASHNSLKRDGSSPKPRKTIEVHHENAPPNKRRRKGSYEGASVKGALEKSEKKKSNEGAKGGTEKVSLKSKSKGGLKVKHKTHEIPDSKLHPKRESRPMELKNDMGHPPLTRSPVSVHSPGKGRKRFASPRERVFRSPLSRDRSRSTSFSRALLTRSRDRRSCEYRQRSASPFVLQKSPIGRSDRSFSGRFDSPARMPSESRGRYSRDISPRRFERSPEPRYLEQSRRHYSDVPFSPPRQVESWNYENPSSYSPSFQRSQSPKPLMSIDFKGQPSLRKSYASKREKSRRGSDFRTSRHEQHRFSPYPDIRDEMQVSSNRGSSRERQIHWRMRQTSSGVKSKETSVRRREDNDNSHGGWSDRSMSPNTTMYYRMKKKSESIERSPDGKYRKYEGDNYEDSSENYRKRHRDMANKLEHRKSSITKKHKGLESPGSLHERGHRRERKPKYSDERLPDAKIVAKNKNNKMADGKMSGLHHARDLKKETRDLSKKEEKLFQELSSELTGRDAAPVLRDRRTGKLRDTEKEQQERREKEQREEERKEKYQRMGRGLKQLEEAKEKLVSDLREMSKPLARYADDDDLDKYLKEQEREGDPMLEYIRSQKKEDQKPEKSGNARYKGSYPPNRFNIRPGYRWDGVDRSNGYEKRWFDKQNQRKALEEEAYRWRTEDM